MSFFSSAAWLLFVIAATAYASFLYLGSSVSAAESHQPIAIRDIVRLGEHHLSGMIMVPSTCDELIIEVKKVNLTTYLLDFSTWSEPAIECERKIVPRSFATTVFAPSVGVTFIASLEGRTLPIAIFPTFAIKP